ncbi:metallophosphatase [Bacteroidales bacterium OttesenSCG-928-A17]|nr:metallophosphatase [Bacteroidales bacterium OttesenSCG-928-A17]
MNFMFKSFHKGSKITLFFLFLTASLLSLKAQDAEKAQDDNIENLVILHMNDTHSRIDPMPQSDSKNPNKGGIIRQNTYVEKVREENKNVLLFHCGDFVQGTPYFNVFKGQAEISLMNYMNFDAVCLGNHEFDYGLNVLADIIRESKFPFIATNFDFSGTPLEGLTRPFHIIYKGDIRIGIIGLTIDPNELVAKKNYEGAKWLDPIASANKVADYLRNIENCDLIICLSHLGIYFSGDEIGDLTLAEQTRNIDIILGGHTHTFLRFPEKRKNLEGKEVVVNQMGANGIYVGRLDVSLEEM